MECVSNEMMLEGIYLFLHRLCITSRMQTAIGTSFNNAEDKVIFSRLNMALVQLVNLTRYYYIMI
jgi:hypothetical protein